MSFIGLGLLFIGVVILLVSIFDDFDFGIFFLSLATIIFSILILNIESDSDKKSIELKDTKLINNINFIIDSNSYIGDFVLDSNNFKIKKIEEIDENSYSITFHSKIIVNKQISIKDQKNKYLNEIDELNKKMKLLDSIDSIKNIETSNNIILYEN